MPRKKIIFENDQYYHIFNRGTDKRKIFMEEGDLYYFFDSLVISNQKDAISSTDRNKRKLLKELAREKEKLVEIIAYALLPNHYHLILKQKVDGGVSKFIQKLGTSYTVYFNNKYERTGVLFQGKFKANHITGDMGLPLTSVYVNLNYKHHKVDPKKSLVKSSIFEYLGEEKGEHICNPEDIKRIIDMTGGPKAYKEYLKGQSKYFTERHGFDSDKIDFTDID